MKLRTVEVHPGEEQNSIISLEQAWIKSTLISIGISADQLDQAQNAPTYSAQKWRNYLLDHFGLEIVKNRTSGNVQIFRTNPDTKQKTIIGEWFLPQIVRTTVKGNRNQLLLRHRP